MWHIPSRRCTYYTKIIRLFLYDNQQEKNDIQQLPFSSPYLPHIIKICSVLYFQTYNNTMRKSFRYAELLFVLFSHIFIHYRSTIAPYFFRLDFFVSYHIFVVHTRASFSFFFCCVVVLVFRNSKNIKAFHGRTKFFSSSGKY